MGIPVLEQIREAYPQLTKSQKRVADYIANTYHEAAFLTASHMAKLLGMNEATVVRFAQRLGYAGFPEMMAEVQELVRGQLRPEAATEGRDPLRALLDKEVETAQRVAARTALEPLRAALRLLAETPRLVVLGQGLSAPLAAFFCASLRSIGRPAECPPADALHLAAVVEEAGPQCSVVAIVALAEALEIANTLRLARERGAHTLAVTWSPTTASAQVAEVALSCPLNDLLLLPSLTAATILLDVLLQSLAAEGGEAVRARQERLAQAQELILARRRR
jgi:DNA-binding MurR/RpiR family transcriptional regulator